MSGSITVRQSISGKLAEKSDIDGEISRPTTVYVRELRFATHYSFPAIGNPEYLYIANDENAIYKFDEETNTYKCIGRDYREIEAIQCCLKE